MYALTCINRKIKFIGQGIVPWSVVQNIKSDWLADDLIIST